VKQGNEKFEGKVSQTLKVEIKLRGHSFSALASQVLIQKN
jgi:hypothetical protein